MSEVLPNVRAFDVAKGTLFESCTLFDTHCITPSPTLRPSVSPTQSPSASPTTKTPTKRPTASPTTLSPTKGPTASPTTLSPTKGPTAKGPTASPTLSPTEELAACRCPAEAPCHLRQEDVCAQRMNLCGDFVVSNEEGGRGHCAAGAYDCHAAPAEMVKTNTGTLSLSHPDPVTLTF